MTPNPWGRRDLHLHHPGLDLPWGPGCPLPRWGKGGLEEHMWEGGHSWFLGGQWERKRGLCPHLQARSPPQNPDGSPTYKNYVTE